MKKLLTLLCALMLAALPLCGAMAQTLDEWNQSCRNKTKSTTTVYSRSDSTRAIATIPGNTYVKVADVGETWTIITYRTASGQSGSGLVHTADLKSAVVFFTDENGDRRGMQELEYADLYGSGTSGSNSAASSGKSTSASAKRTGSAAKQQPALTVTHEGEAVTVTQLGVHTTTIVKSGEALDVPTAGLVFAEGVPADKAVAVIHAPRTGKCTLRKAASTGAKSLGQCKAGTIVPVLEVGSGFCKIVCDSEVGYVLTSCLKFCGGADAPTGTAVLTWNGKVTGKTKINIRNDADSSARKIAQWRTGTEVLVFGQQGAWVEIGHEGLHGFVHEDYLTVSQ
ncbi:MAG: SH3 domain-containing protein [Clostridia bacterium]|nr:SH3 domain-containing protein [Clostridia bacterium]